MTGIRKDMHARRAGDSATKLKRRTAIVAVVAVAAIVAAAAAHWLRGDRYKLLTDPLAGRCWASARALALSTSSLRPQRVAPRQVSADGGAIAEIGYSMDRTFGGVQQTIRCKFAAGSDVPEAIEINGIAVDDAALAEIERELGP
jgi:hypothetical protein